MATRKPKKPLTYTQIVRGLKGLTTDEQTELYERLKKKLFPSAKPPKPFFSRLDELRSARCPATLACPHCNGTHLNLHGKYRGRQRYLCRNPLCGKTFNDTSMSPLSGTHYPGKWDDYLSLMTSDMSLRKIAAALGISVGTAFYWRHKILTAIRERAFDRLEGVVEADETFFIESFKGQRNVLAATGRKPRKHGGKGKKRGLSKEQVCVFTAVDQNGNIMAKVAGRGTINAKTVGSLLSSSAAHITTLCSDAAGAYKTFSANRHVHHEVFVGHERSRGGVGIQHVNAYHSGLKKWIRRFNGVSTRWLNNYLCLFRLRYKHPITETQQMAWDMLLRAYKQPNNLSVKGIYSLT